MKRFFLMNALLATLISVHSRNAFTYSFNAIPGMTGEGILSLTPTLTLPMQTVFGAQVDLIGTAGLTPQFDIYIDAADFNIAPSAKYSYSWIMPRIEILPDHILALQLFLTNSGQDSFSIAPQYQLFLENENWAFELNAVYMVPLIFPVTSTTLSAIIAPVWKAIKGALYPFIEIDPSYEFSKTGRFHLNLVPGICIETPNSQQEFCLAFSLNDITSGLPNYSAKFNYTFTLNLNSGSVNQ